MPGRETGDITRSADLHTAVRYVGAITRGPGATEKDSKWRRNIEEWEEELRGTSSSVCIMINTMIS